MNAKEARTLFERELPQIEQIIRFVSFRRSLTVEDRQEFYSWVMLEFIRDEHYRIRKYRGLGSFGAYITTVIQRLYVDFRIHHWGKWRPSKRATSLGDVAQELERLLYREGRDFDEAAKVLASRREDCPSRETLWAWHEQLPHRASRRFRELGDADVPSPDSLEETLFSEERETMQARLAEDLAEALTRLSDEQNLIIRMSTQDGLTAREIGEAMRLCPRKVYSKRSQALGKLRATMTAAGWVSSEVEALMEWKGFDLSVA